MQIYGFTFLSTDLIKKIIFISEIKLYFKIYYAGSVVSLEMKADTALISDFEMGFPE